MSQPFFFSFKICMSLSVNASTEKIYASNKRKIYAWRKYACFFFVQLHDPDDHFQRIKEEVFALKLDVS